MTAPGSTTWPRPRYITGSLDFLSDGVRNQNRQGRLVFWKPATGDKEFTACDQGLRLVRRRLGTGSVLPPGAKPPHNLLVTDPAQLRFDPQGVPEPDWLQDFD